MTEVLYTMRNGKIADPNIPTDGLICYLDARGKTNNDIYKNVLLDLSGNGNHGRLQSFSFTDGSGYENGGLQFDGVDDVLIYSHNLKMTDPRTIFIDMELEQTAKEQGVQITLPFGLVIHDANNFIYNLTRSSYFNTGINTGEGILKGTHKFVITIESTVETGKMYYNGQVYANEPQGSVGTYHYDPKQTYMLGKRKINRAMLYNRVLTDTEIQQLMEV